MSKQSKSIGSDNPVTLAREAIADSEAGSTSNQRQWRAFVREKHLAEALLEADKTKRALRKQVKELQVALAKACDWALDSADVIADEGVCDPEDGEDTNFRDTILGLRALSKQPEAERHIARRKVREREEREKAAAKLPSHNHVTRDIKKRGVCPACDAYHACHDAPSDVKPDTEHIGVDSDGEYMTDGKRW
jgi:hypothetical protein